MSKVEVPHRHWSEVRFAAVPQIVKVSWWAGTPAARRPSWETSQCEGKRGECVRCVGQLIWNEFIKINICVYESVYVFKGTVYTLRVFSANRNPAPGPTAAFLYRLFFLADVLSCSTDMINNNITNSSVLVKCPIVEWWWGSLYISVSH